MNLPGIAIGAALGLVSAVVLAQFMELIPAVVIGAIAGGSIAVASRTANGGSAE